MKIQDLFKQVAKENANKIAVRAGGEILTYSEIDKMSDYVASQLIKEPTPRPIPIAYSSSLRMVGFILAVLKTGNIAAVIKKSDLGLHEEVPPYNDGAFFAFTSGSTGSSKAVVYSHRGMIALAETEKKAYHFKDDEIIGSYRGGAPLYRTLCDALLNGLTWSCCDGKLDEWIVREKITHLGLTATAFRNLIASSLKFPSLRWLSVGGEIVDWEDFALFKHSDKFSDDCVFLCRYACSETHTVSLLTLNKRCQVRDGRLPVGRPLPGVEIKLIGEEIAVHSSYLAIEYWQDEALTKEKFKVEEATGKRWYHTGDRGYFKDGILHHEGRI